MSENVLLCSLLGVLWCHAFWPAIEYRLGVPMIPSSDCINLLRAAHRTLTCINCINELKNMIQNTDGQPDTEIHEARSGRLSSAETSVPGELMCILLLVFLLPIWKLSRPHAFGILWRLPFLMDGAENSKFLIMAWSFLWPTTNLVVMQEPIQCHFRRTEDSPSALHLGN